MSLGLSILTKWITEVPYFTENKADGIKHKASSLGPLEQKGRKQKYIQYILTDMVFLTLDSLTETNASKKFDFYEAEIKPL